MSDIDEKVVSMQFDNKNFEENAQESLRTIDKLESGLKFAGAAVGLDKLQGAISSLSFNPITGALDVVTSRFSALETMATGALMRIGAKVENFATSTLKAFTVDNLSAGWKKFSDKTTSVATLVSQGNSLEKVNGQLEKLNWFTDETSYNFVDMVSNIGKFTATGVDLEDAVGAMEGIATWTALSGQNAATASRAMYQISQAMGAGVMRKEDYKSIQNASMDTEEFRQKALDAGVALGTLRKESNGSYTSIVKGAKQSTFEIGQFADHLTQEQWFTKEVMMEVFGDYSAAVDELYKAVESGEYSTASEAIAAMGDDLDAFGLKAFEAAQEARTWEDVVDSVKDAVSTGWMTTWEIIFGNYEEAKELWTDLANEFYDIFAEGGNARNEMLKEWKELGGRDELIDTFWELYSGIRDVMDLISESFRSIFPRTTAQDLLNLTETIRKYIHVFNGMFAPFNEMVDSQLGHKIEKQMSLAGESVDDINIIAYQTTTRIENFKNSLSGIFAAADIVIQAVKAAAKGLGIFLGYLIPTGSRFLDFTGNIGEYVVQLDEFIKKNDVFGKAIDKLRPIIRTVAVVTSKTLGIIRAALEGLWSFIGPVFENFIGMTEKVEETAQAADRYIPNFLKTKDAVEEVGDAAEETTKKFSFLDKLFGRLKEIFSALSPLVEAVKKSLNEMWDNLHKGIIDSINNFDLSKLLDIGKGAAVAAVWVFIKKLFAKFKDVVTDLDDIKEKVVKILDSVRGAIDAWKSSQLAETLLKVAIALAILAAALFVLSTVNPKNLLFAVGAIAALAAVLIVVLKAIEKITSSGGDAKEGVAGKLQSVFESFFGSDDTTNMVKVAGVMIAIAAAVLILSAAVKNLAAIKWTSLVKGILAVAALMAVLLATMFLMTKMEGEVVKGAGTLMMVGNAVGNLTNSVEKLSKLSVNELIKGVGSVAVLILALGAFARIAGNLNFRTGLAITLTAASLVIITNAVKTLGEMNIDELTHGIFSVLALLTGLAAFTQLAKNVKLGSGISFVLIAATIKIIVQAVKEMGNFDKDKMLQGLQAIGAIFVEIAAFTRIVKSKGILKTAVAMVVMAASLKMFSGVIKSLGEMTDEQAGKGISVLAVGLLELMAAAQGMKKSLGAAAGMLVMSAALIAMAVALRLMGSLPWDNLLKGLVAFAGILLIIGVAAYALQPVVFTILTLSFSFMSMSVSMLALSIGFSKLVSVITILSGVIRVALPNIVAAVVESIGIILEAIGGLALDIAEAVVKIILAIVDAVSRNIGPIVQLGIKLIAGLALGLVQALPALVEIAVFLISVFLNSLADAIRNEAPKLFEAVLNILDAIFDMVIEFIAMILEKIPLFGDSAAETIRGAKDWMIPAFEENADEVANAYADKFNLTMQERQPDMTSSMDETGSNTSGTFGDNGLANANEYINGYLDADWEGAGIDGIGELKDGMFGELSASGVDIDAEGLMYGNNVPESIKTGISENSDAPAEAVNEMIDKAKVALEKFPQDSEETGRKIPDSLRSGINSKASTVKTAANNLKSNIQGPLRNINMTSIGQAIPEGIANGMGSRSYLVRNKVQELSNMIPEGLKKLLGINSPSKVVAALMEFVPEGAAVGIDRAMYYVHDSISNMTNTMTDGITNGIRNISEMVEDDLDVNPTITPVMDLSQIQNGAVLANGILSGIRSNIGVNRNLLDVQSPRPTTEMIQDALNGAMADISNTVYGRLNDNTNYTIEVPVVLDGREVARVTAPYTKNEIARLDRNSSRRGGIL